MRGRGEEERYIPFEQKGCYVGGTNKGSLKWRES